MISSKKLNDLFLLSLVLIYAHGVEEVVTGFQHHDVFMVYGAGLFNTTTEVYYWLTHLLWWMLLPVLFVLFRKKRLGFLLMTVYGAVFIIELHHPIKGFVTSHYYPGMLTAMLYPFFGFFYWKQIVKDWRKKLT